MFVVLELLDYPFGFVLALCILRLDCKEVRGVVTNFSVTFRIAQWCPR